jgi:hypothetical protein
MGGLLISAAPPRRPSSGQPRCSTPAAGPADRIGRCCRRSRWPWPPTEPSPCGSQAPRVLTSTARLKAARCCLAVSLSRSRPSGKFDLGYRSKIVDRPKSLPSTASFLAAAAWARTARLPTIGWAFAMIAINNEYQLFQDAGFVELLGCVSIAEAQANLGKSLADLAKREAKVAMQEALVIREVGERWLVQFDKSLLVAATPS